jgi:ABC-type multidrug transport system ATPase subunit
VRVAYYDQRLGGLEPENTLIDELIRLVGEREAHNLLGRFLFPYQAQFKRISQLSGGERARLALLKLTLGEANVLVLDEPTNHLDVEMIEALEAALGDFEGTLLLVSHDRRFVERLATRVWRVAGGEFRDYPGDWSYYERKRREEGEAAAIPEPAATPAPLRASAPGPAAVARRSRWQLQRDLERLEGEIMAHERELQEVRLALGAAAPTTDPGQWAALGRRHDQLEGELLAAIAEWEAISDALLAAGAG